MWRSKKFIVGVLLAIVLVAGSIGGIALAQENGDNSQPGARFGTLLDEVCKIYKDNTGDTINADELQKAFDQAQSEMQVAAMENHLARLVEEGVIDETQAQDILEWWESRPDVPVKFGFVGRGGFHGMGVFRGFGGPCTPAE